MKNSFMAISDYLSSKSNLSFLASLFSYGSISLRGFINSGMLIKSNLKEDPGLYGDYF